MRLMALVILVLGFGKMCKREMISFKEVINKGKVKYIKCQTKKEYDINLRPTKKLLR